MITGSLKSKIDRLWLEFHSGGITNPLTVIEQISFLMFARMLDLREQAAEKRARRTNSPNPETLFSPDQQHLRWSHIIQLSAEQQLTVVRDKLFPYFREEIIGKSSLAEYLTGAQFMIQKPQLLKNAMNMIEDLPLSTGDTKGDLYEYLLGKLTTAGVAGQFRTPRHVISTMVEMLRVQPEETVCDPACGTAGFLIETMQYLKRVHSTPDLIVPDTGEDTGKPVLDDHGQPVMLYPGDKLAPYRSHLDKGMFHGFDFDSTMLRIAAMNMLLHGIDNPSIQYKDSLSERSQVAQDHEGAFDVVLANPPFKGSIDHESVFSGLTSVAKTKKTELLFLVLIVKLLKTGGRAAVIVPDGVLFGSSSAHRAVREMLIEQNQLDAVVSLPSGVFKPYAGVSTAILFFTKGDPKRSGQTRNVWFYKVENDGYSLDDKRTPLTTDGKPTSDLPDLIAKWTARDEKTPGKRTARSFFVPYPEIVGAKYDLSYNRYSEVKYEETTYDDPADIIAQLRDLESEISDDLATLEELLR